MRADLLDPHPRRQATLPVRAWSHVELRGYVAVARRCSRCMHFYVATDWCGHMEWRQRPNGTNGRGA